MPHRIGLIAVLSLSIGVIALAQGAGSGPSQGAVPGGAPGQRTPARRPGMPAEPAATGTGIIRGSVIALESGVPLRRVQVRISAMELRDSRMATTDGLGRFEFRELPAGRYRLSASKGGLVSLQYGQRRPAQQGTPIELGNGQVLEKITMALPRGSVISGRITDEFGEPVASASVSAMQSRVIGGARRWINSGPSDRTDDLGQFRLYGLPPGEYIVSATYQMMSMETDTSPDASGFAPTYFPGVPGVGDAQRITLGLGEENSSVSFGLIATHVVSVEGTVTNAQGSPVTAGMVMLLPHDPTGQTPMMFSGNYNGRIEQGGRFRIGNVAPGRYIAQAQPMGQNTGEIARTPVTVGNEKVERVALVMAPGGRILGRVVTDTGAPLPADIQSTLRITAGAMNPTMAFIGGGGMATVNADGTFELRGLVDPRIIRVFGPGLWMLKAVLVSGQDYVDSAIDVQPGQTVTGMEVVLSNRINSVAGVVTDARGLPVVDASVLVFPDDPALWKQASRHVKSTRPDTEGRYLINALPPSDAYLAIAVRDYEEGQINDPAYLATIRGDAQRFSLREGETKVLDLRQK